MSLQAAFLSVFLLFSWLLVTYWGVNYHIESKYSSVYPVNPTFDKACVTLRLCLLGQHGWHGAAATDIPSDLFLRLSFSPIPYSFFSGGSCMMTSTIFFVLKGVCCSEWLEHDLNWCSSANRQFVEPLKMSMTEDKLKARNHAKNWATSANNICLEIHQKSHSWTLNVVMFNGRKPSIFYSFCLLFFLLLMTHTFNSTTHLGEFSRLGLLYSVFPC